MQASIGTIIHGTLRPQDLIPAFLAEVERLAPVAKAYPLPNDDDPWWDSDDCGHTLEALFVELAELAPPYCYFGAHPGDGSDFGFWPDWESIEDSCQDGDVARVTDPVELDAVDSVTRAALVVNDHGNTAFYVRNPSGGWVLRWDCV